MGIIFGEHAFEGRVVALNGEHRLIDGLADGGLFGTGFEVRPAGLPGDPEDVDSPILIRVFRIGALGAFGIKFGVLLLEGVGNVFEEDQAEDDMFVFGGIHVGAERIGGLPQFPFKTEVGAIAVFGHVNFPLLIWYQTVCISVNSILGAYFLCLFVKWLVGEV